MLKKKNSESTDSELKATPGIEPGIKVLQTRALPLGYVARVTPSRFELLLPPWKGDVLTTWPWGHILFNFFKQAPRVGLEPTTTRLTAECSTIELSRKIWKVLRTLKTAHTISYII